ncbi:MAG: hypothetical protein AAB429_00190 [Patescibacteria group bacterium]|mgnify:FL=1
MNSWDRTGRMRRRVYRKLDEDGRYCGYQLIERNTKVKGRVYLGALEREADVASAVAASTLCSPPSSSSN